MAENEPKQGLAEAMKGTAKHKEKRKAERKAKAMAHGAKSQQATKEQQEQRTAKPKAKAKAKELETRPNKSLKTASTTNPEAANEKEQGSEETKGTTTQQRLKPKEQSSVEGLEGERGESRWVNKQRTLLVCSRGVNRTQRDLANELHILLPNSKKEVKVDHKTSYEDLLELCYLRSCNNFLFFESRKRKHLFLWIGRAPNGPCFKCHVENSKRFKLTVPVTTFDELKLTGNCLKGSRPILSFDGSFEGEPVLDLFREIAVNVFTTPNFHPKSKPFIDHSLSFNFTDNRIWFRNYQALLLTYPFRLSTMTQSRN